jgi:homoserine O-acetyltransferase
MRDVEVRYNTFGHLNEAKDNVLVVCHALTGNARLDTWWSSILGPGKAFDTDKYLVVCANILGKKGGRERGEGEKGHACRNEVGAPL